MPVTLDEEVKQRIQTLTSLRRSAHWTMHEASHVYVEQPEQPLAFYQETHASLNDDQATNVPMTAHQRAR